MGTRYLPLLCLKNGGERVCEFVMSPLVGMAFAIPIFGIALVAAKKYGYFDAPVSPSEPVVPVASPETEKLNQKACPDQKLPHGSEAV